MRNYSNRVEFFEQVFYADAREHFQQLIGVVENDMPLALATTATPTAKPWKRVRHRLAGSASSTSRISRAATYYGNSFR